MQHINSHIPKTKNIDKGVIFLAVMTLFAIAVSITFAVITERSQKCRHISIKYKDGMLVIESVIAPAEAVLVWRDGGQAVSMAYTLTGTETWLPPVCGDGEYSIYISASGTYVDASRQAHTSVCAVTGSGGPEMFLSPSLTMAESFSLLSQDVQGMGFEDITEMFVRCFGYSDLPNEGLMSPYTPDPAHTRELRSGSCADLSALYALYLRSAGIPVKVVYGDRTVPGGRSAAHAWTEVYMDGVWKIVDITALCVKKDCSEPFAQPGMYGGRYCIY